jgi:hypothetical protein
MFEIERSSRADIETLIKEIERYLDVVAVFRAQGCEPAWRVVGANSERKEEVRTS